MRRTFASMHVRAICHATEDEQRVRQALVQVVGDAPLDVTEARGHHGNRIIILEAELKDPKTVEAFFGRFSDDDLDRLRESIDQRMDEGCNFFVRVDKQAAYGGTVKLAGNDDAILVRLRISTYPAKRETACEITRLFLDEQLVKKQPR